MTGFWWFLRLETGVLGIPELDPKITTLRPKPHFEAKTRLSVIFVILVIFDVFGDFSGFWRFWRFWRFWWFWCPNVFYAEFRVLTVFMIFMFLVISGQKGSKKGQKQPFYRVFTVPPPYEFFGGQKGVKK